MKATIEQLTQIPLFSACHANNLERLQPHTQIFFYQQGEIVVHEGDPLPEKLYILFVGELYVKKNASTGKETILRSLQSGDIFAAPALFGNKTAPATILAIENSQILTIQKGPLLEAIHHTPELSLRLLVVFNERLQQLHNMVHGLISERALVRLARLIQYTAWNHGTEILVTGERLRVKLPYYQMARSIGITYEECARLMKALQQEVRYERGGKIIILNREGLEAVASGEKLDDH